MFTAIYRWRLREGGEARFLDAWRVVTEYFAEHCGSYGSRLHRESDGTLCAIALWPDREAWSSARLPDAQATAVAVMRESILETLPIHTMDVVEDMWRNGVVPLREGYIDVPAGMHANVVTNLQMLEAPKDLAAPQLPFELERLAPVYLERYRQLFRAVGEPYMWFSRLRLSNEALGAIVNSAHVEVYAAVQDGRDIGILELDFRVAGECEIVFFGFTTDAVGKGYGSALMRFALRRAWSHPLRRVWLHTCTNDHPAALPFYEKHGFKRYSNQVEIHT